MRFHRYWAAFAAAGTVAAPVAAQTGFPIPPAPPRATPVGLPQDAGPHDESTIEWWYFNSFLTGESGRRYAVVGSFFRTGFGPAKKGHYLIYALADLDAKKKIAYSVLDKANIELLKSYLPLVVSQKPDDPRPMQLLAMLQKGRLPRPHRLLAGTVQMTARPFAIRFGKNALRQVTPDARQWRATLVGDDFALDLTLSQPERPAMLVGGEGRTGLARPDDMFYVSLTRMRSEGTLTRNGKSETVRGDGWLDRQWGTSWVAGDNGWDWFGVQLSDGSDLIVYRVKDNATGKVLRAEATLLRADGSQIVDRAPTFAATGRWTDPATGIAYPQVWTVRLPKTGHTLTMTPAFPAQTIPVIGIGDAIWEGAVTVSGRGPKGTAVAGRGYMELVGYRAGKTSRAPSKTAR